MFKALVTSFVVLLAANAVQAADIDQRYLLTGTGFGANAPIATIQADISLKFDMPYGSYGFTTEGLTVNALNLPGAQPIGVSAGYSSIGPYFHIDSVDGSGSSVFHADFIDPRGNYGYDLYPLDLSYKQDGTTYTAGSFTLSRLEALPEVPEMATWEMLIVGFGGIGMAYRYRTARAIGRRASAT